MVIRIAMMAIPCSVALGCLLFTSVALAAPEVRIVAPSNGSTVRGPDVTVTIALTDLALVPAAQATRLEDLHVHYLLDVDPSPWLDGRTPVPAGDAKIVHSAATSNMFQAVDPGSHRVAVLVGLSNHAAVQPPIAPSVTFTVAAQGGPPSQLPSAGEGDSPVGLMLGAGVIGLVGGTLVRRLRRGSGVRGAR